MPAIMSLACNRCNFARKGIQNLTVVIKADGEEVICPHPLESTYAEEATGLSWSELSRAGRIRYRSALVCLGCGELDYYGPDQLGEGMARWTHIGNIVRSVRRREARMHRCRACGYHDLEPLKVDETEWEIWGQLFNWIRGKPNGPFCPACHVGQLRSRMTAIS
jgi:hypothetical protein